MWRRRTGRPAQRTIGICSPPSGRWETEWRARCPPATPMFRSFLNLGECDTADPLSSLQGGGVVSVQNRCRLLEQSAKPSEPLETSLAALCELVFRFKPREPKGFHFELSGKFIASFLQLPKRKPLPQNARAEPRAERCNLPHGVVPELDQLRLEIGHLPDELSEAFFSVCHLLVPGRQPSQRCCRSPARGACPRERSGWAPCTIFPFCPLVSLSRRQGDRGRDRNGSEAKELDEAPQNKHSTSNTCYPAKNGQLKKPVYQAQ